MRNNRQNTDGMQGINCHKLKKKLQTVEFALIDTALYLNAYPDCKQALEYYHKLLDERDDLTRVINEKCGPITAMSNVSRSDWNWVSGPWPWEVDAN